MTNRRYDFEYSTQYRKEYFYLLDRGFKPVFIKRSEDGVNTYKYKRTSKLFAAISSFYEQEENEKQFEALSKLTEAINNNNETEGILTINPEVLKRLFAKKEG